MSQKAAIAKTLLQRWKELKAQPEKALNCFIGFDGFTDDIVAAVEQRLSPESYKRFETIGALGDKIKKAAGQSCNIELAPLQCKMGGNAVILANALIEGLHRITLAATVGSEKEIEPLFLPLTSRCSATIPLGPSGHSDAIEFQDGKIILGKLTPLLNLTAQSLLDKIPLKTLITLFSESNLIVNANWTMTPMMNLFWRYLEEHVIASLPLPTKEKPRYFFVDLADPDKRSDSDLLEAINCLAALNDRCSIILGLNRSEACRLLQLVEGTDICSLNNSSEGLTAALKLKEKIEINTVLIHCAHWAAAASEGSTAVTDTAFCPHPLLSTGAGDHFNAGFCNGLLYGLSLEGALICAVASGAFYVHNGKTATIAELAQFIEFNPCP